MAKKEVFSACLWTKNIRRRLKACSVLHYQNIVSLLVIFSPAQFPASGKGYFWLPAGIICLGRNFIKTYSDGRLIFGHLQIIHVARVQAFPRHTKQTPRLLYPVNKKLIKLKS